jgi:hydrogenase/urease accessory protein HupE
VKCLALLLCLLGTLPCVAHEARPLAVTVTEISKRIYRVEVRVPGTVEPANRPRVVWPADCRATAAERIQCAESIEGRDIAIAWPAYNPAITALLRFVPVAGSVRAAVLSPGAATWRIPREPSRRAVMGNYFELGVAHILGGIDHLLFVAGLMLIARSVPRILLATTGFTLAHSLTLSLAALGWIRFPVPPTEAVIALSILFLAREALSETRSSVVHRFPLLVSAMFGLLHGLGFAAALGEVGLPEKEIVTALLFFNVGVEVGQIAFILAVASMVAVIERVYLPLRSKDAWTLWMLNRVAAYAMGVPAAFWLLQRLLLQFATVGAK